jgi:hypothetical protein
MPRKRSERLGSCMTGEGLETFASESAVSAPTLCDDKVSKSPRNMEFTGRGPGLSEPLVRGLGLPGWPVPPIFKLIDWSFALRLQTCRLLVVSHIMESPTRAQSVV